MEEEVGKASFSDPEGFHWRIAQEGSGRFKLVEAPKHLTPNRLAQRGGTFLQFKHAQ